MVITTRTKKWQLWSIKMLEQWVVICPNMPESEIRHASHGRLERAKCRAIGLVCAYIRNKLKEGDESGGLIADTDLPTPPAGMQVTRMNSQ